jgi:hypothetical protein
VLAGGLEAVWEEGFGGCWECGCGCCGCCHFSLGFGLGFDGMEVGVFLDGWVGLDWIGLDCGSLVVCSALFFESDVCSLGREVTRGVLECKQWRVEVVLIDEDIDEAVYSRDEKQGHADVEDNATNIHRILDLDPSLHSHHHCRERER